MRRAGPGVRDLPPALVAGSLIVGVLIVVGLVGPFVMPASATEIDVARRLLPLGSDGHLLGTDHLGRDALGQIVLGTRNTLFVCVVATTASLVPGILLGLLTAAAPGIVQSVLIRAIDVGLAFPGILIALVLATVLGPGNTGAIIAIVIWFVPAIARVVIGPAQQILARDYIEAAWAYGRSRPFTLFRHVLPNISSVLIVQASLMFAAAILIEAALAYLGLGAPRPTASWGRLLQEGQTYVDGSPHLVLFPGIAIVVAVLGFNLLGDGLRVLLDPRRMVRVTAI